MKILENNKDLIIFLKIIRKKKLKIGLIPTMGSIHKGHLSLIKKSKKLSFFSIVTIFINPTQFNNMDDFKNYPKNLENDIKLLKKYNTDLLFIPSESDLYPNGIKKNKSIFEYRNILCDKFRPGHFDGVTTVVSTLFNLINPASVFFGEKDYQQLKLIEKLIEKNKNKILMNRCKSIRLLNGMSFSSRYNNFRDFEKKIFNNIANEIALSLKQLKSGISEAILINLKNKLKENNINKIDYLEVRNEINLTITHKIDHARLFVAFHIGNTRVIDNFILY